MDKNKYWLILLFYSYSFGYEMKSFVEVKNLNIEVEKRVSVNREYYLDDTQSAKNNVNLNLNLDIFKNLFFNNKLISITDSDQFRFIGYDFYLGYRLSNGIDIYFNHFSGHAMDYTFDSRDFPQKNAVGLRFNLIGE